MPLPEPPNGLPRIVEVQDPSTGQHIVRVRLTSDYAAKYPDKAWGTAITAIGLSSQLTAQFAGYTLVDIEPIPGTKDLDWIFQKLPGPTLSGQDAYVERELGNFTEQDVAPGTAATTGLLVVDSKVMPDGKGKSVKRTVSVPSWTAHTGSRWDEELEAQVAYTEQMVAPPDSDDLLEEFTSFQIVNKDRANKIVEVVPTDALDNFLVHHPVRVDLSDLPRELLSVSVIWNEGYSIGNQDYSFFASRTGSDYSLGKSASDSASSAASVSCELALKFKDFATNNIFGERIMIYIPAAEATTAGILDKLTEVMGEEVALWPVFKPESETLVTTAQSVSVRSNVQVSLGAQVSDGVTVGQEWDKGTSDDFQINVNNSAVQLPSCIHGAISFSGDTSKSRSVSATAFMNMTHSLIGGITASRTKVGQASGSVSPSSLSAVEGLTAIPTSGLYLMDMTVTPRKKYGYFPVTAIVFDASNLA